MSIVALLRLARNSIIIVLVCISGNLIQAQDHRTQGLFSPVDPPGSEYNITCSFKFDTTTAIVSGTETITLKNNSTLPIEMLTVDWPGDSLQKLNITVDGKTVKVLSDSSSYLYHNLVVIKLPRAIRPKHKLEIEAQFERTYNFEPGDYKHLWTNWFPRIYWGMQAQDDFIARIENKSKYVLASSGIYNPKTGAYHAEGIRQFGVYFLKDAAITEQTIDGIRVRIIHTPDAAECANLVMNTAVDVIAYYKKRFGFYPSKHLEIAQGVDSPNGGYPAATNLVVIHGMERMSERDELHWRWITAHEIGHQYWTEYVMPEPPDQLGWLMIGLGIYVDREYTRYSGMAPDRHIALMNRYINGVREGLDTRADVYSDYLDDIEFDFNNVVIHGKGYSIISALNRFLGDELFDRIHSRCLREFAGKRMGFYDFQTVCEQESGQDLNWFFNQWVRSTRFLAYEITTKECTPQNDGYISDIIVEKIGTLDMPIPVTTYFSDNTQQTKFTGRLQTTSVLQFESKAALDSAVIDANHEFPIVKPSPSLEEQAIRKKLSSLPSRADIDSLKLVAAKALDLDIEQTLFWGKLGRQLYDWSLYEEALTAFEHRAKLLEEAKSEWIVSAYGWQGLLLDLLGRRSEAIAAYEKALELPTENDFSYNGDPVIINNEWLKARIKIPFTRSGNQ